MPWPRRTKSGNEQWNNKSVKVSPCVDQKWLRFDNKTGAHEFMKFTKKYHQQVEEEQAIIGQIVCAMSPPKLADTGGWLQEASRD